MEISYSFTGKGNEIEIGVYDPEGFRGTSRFSKSTFYIGRYRATASYFPGRIQAGGWSEESAVYSKLGVLEVINGTNIENGISGIPFWHALLNKGYRIIGIGGSDDYGAGTGTDKPGIPTTRIFADSLSEASILAGIRRGNVYIKTRGNESPDIEFYATSGSGEWKMGEIIPLKSISKKRTLHMSYTSPTDQETEVIQNREVIPAKIKSREVNGYEVKILMEIPVKTSGWIRFNLRDKDGITVLSNPVFIW